MVDRRSVASKSRYWKRRKFTRERREGERQREGKNMKVRADVCAVKKWRV